jgi:hypothetical protein
MQIVALPFAIMGFVFGTIAFSYATSATARIERLERRLVDAGVVEEESVATLRSDPESS